MRLPAITGLVAIASLAFLAAAVVAPARAEDQSSEKSVKPIRALLVCGGCYHDYKAQKDILAKGLKSRLNIDLTVSYDPHTDCTHVNPAFEKEDWGKGYDVVIHDECTAQVTDDADIRKILAPHEKGLAAVVLHCAMHSYRGKPFPETTPWMEFTGMNTNHHGAQTPIEVTYTDKESPITKGLTDWTTIHEELYHEEKLLPTAHALANGKQKETNVVVWTNDYHGTRVFSTTLGHNNETVEDPRYLDLVARGLLWATGHLTDDGKPAPGYGRESGQARR